MKRMMRRVLAVLLVIGMLATLMGCALLSSDENRVTDLVQGNLDHVYLGKYEPKYLLLVELNEEEAETQYQMGLAYEAEYFAYYWGILGENETFDELDADLQQSIIDLYDEIYGYSSYDVEKAVRQSDGSYTVKVRIRPIDIMEQAMTLYENGTYLPLEVYFAKAAELDGDQLADETYWSLTNEYGHIIVEMVRSLLPELGYGEQKSQVIQVDETEDGYLQINEDDFAIFDEYVIYYP